MKSRVLPPVPLPTIHRLTQPDLTRLYPDLLDEVHRAFWTGGVEQIDPHVTGAYHLAPGSVFVSVPQARIPFLFVSELPGHHSQDAYMGRAHVVVAREYGDLSWPAWLRAQRAQAIGDAHIAVARGLGDVKDHLTPGWRTWHRYGRTAA